MKSIDIGFSIILRGLITLLVNISISIDFIVDNLFLRQLKITYNVPNVIIWVKKVVHCFLIPNTPQYILYNDNIFPISYLKWACSFFSVEGAGGTLQNEEALGGPQLLGNW